MSLIDRIKQSFSFWNNPEAIKQEVQKTEKELKKKEVSIKDIVPNRLLNTTITEALDDGLDGYATRDELRDLDGDAEITRVLRLPKVRSAFKRLTSEVFSSNLELISESEDPKAEEILKFNQVLFNQVKGNFETILKEGIVVALMFQNYFGEIVPRIMDTGEFKGKLIIDRVKSKRPGILEFITDDYDNVLGLHSLIKLDDYYPEDRFLILAFDAMFSNPYGYTLYASLRRFCKAYNMVYQDMITYSSRYSQPIPNVSYPSGMDNLQEIATRISENLYNGARLAIPEEIKVEFIQAAQNGNVPHTVILEYIEKQMSLAILGEDLGHGSYASDKVKADERTIFVYDIKKQIQDIYFEQIIRRFTPLNYDINQYHLELYPIIKFALPEMNKTEFVQQVATGAGIGIVNVYDKKFIEFYYKNMGYPMPEEDLIPQQDQQNIDNLIPDNVIPENTPPENFSLISDNIFDYGFD